MADNVVNRYDDKERKHGPWREGNLDGSCIRTSVYDHGRMHGSYEYRSYDGYLLLKGYYRYDKKHGPWTITW